MKKMTIFTAMTVSLLSCSSIDNRVTVQDTFSNGQPKTVIYKTVDDKATYYEIEYDSLGRIMEISPYSEGIITGTKVYFRDNLEVGAILPHKNGQREGFTYEFSEGQQVRFKGESKNGEFNGLSTWFHEDGKPSETGIRTNGKKEGEWIQYHENGIVVGRGTYLNGSKQDDWLYWNSDGTPDTTKQK